MAEQVLVDWRDWKEYGMLPFHGDMNDQPFFVYEAFAMCSKISEIAMNERAERESAKASAANG